MFCNYFPLLLGLLSALLGGLIGWHLLKNGRLATTLGLVDEKDTHIEGLQQDLSSQKTHYSRLHSDYESQTQTLSGWKGKFSNATTELATLGAAKLALDLDFDKHRAASATTIQGLEGQLTDLKLKYQNLETVQKTLKSEFDTKIVQLADTNGQLKTAHTKIADINVQLTDAHTKIADANARLTDAHIKIADTKAQLTNAHTEIADTKAQLTTAQTEIADTKAQLTNAQTEIADTKAQLTTAHTEIADCKAQLT